MARIQILELPTIYRDEGPDETPYILVIDGWDILSFDENTMLNDYWDAFAKKIGARGVLFTDRTVDIPANETPVDPDGYPLKIRIEGDFEQFREQVQDEITKAQNEILDRRDATMDAQRMADGRTGIARDADRLANHKAALLDALGMDHTRDWDDIRNAAAGLRKKCDAQATEVAQLREGEEPVTDQRVAPNPGQWIWQWNRATPEKRLSMAAQIIDGMAIANNCFMADHEARISSLNAELERLRTGHAATSRDITVDNAADVVAPHDPSHRA
ncbi:hypothetical protein OG352_06435 [Streptomyces sp. NBC_01485]|uniref:hypothetical protein n=1 Tax=Streptomyces sp. NBC_01485 TaxID=2903884 RepID=UPI002E32A87A|nr:hypothetical protein [Streptomyces sp. NBC_01485]